MRTRAQTERRAEPSLLARLLHLLALSAGVVAAPVLAQLGNHPNFFTAFGARGGGTWAFALTVVFVPPLLLWAVGLVAELIHPRLGRAVHVAAIGLLGAMLGLLLAKALTAGTLVSLLLAVLVAAGGPAPPSLPLTPPPRPAPPPRRPARLSAPRRARGGRRHRRLRAPAARPPGRERAGVDAAPRARAVRPRLAGRLLRPGPGQPRGRRRHADESDAGRHGRVRRVPGVLARGRHGRARREAVP